MVDKFNTLINYISRNLLLTVSGLAQEEKDLDDFYHELRCNISENGHYKNKSMKKIKLE